jgi:phospholipase C
MHSSVGILRRWRAAAACCVSVVALSTFGYTVTADSAPKAKDAAASVKTATPIKHVIILIGENRGLDHTFGIYKPKGAGQTISNLLSKGIINEDGSPGPNFKLSQQFSVSPQPLWYFGAPDKAKTPYSTSNPMPQPNSNGAPGTQGDLALLGVTSAAGLTNQFPDAPVTSFADFAPLGGENDIEPANQAFTTTGATGLKPNVLDTRVPGAGSLPPGSFQLLGANINDDDYTGDMTHRFFQAAQQQDCNLANKTKTNPSGCLNDLFPFVMDTYDRSATAQGNFSEGNEMGFYNAEEEEWSVLKQLADRFTLSDNFHQSFLGGTGANHVMLGTGDAVFWSDGKGNATTPSVASLIANPNPAPGTINKYTVDGNFTNCSDVTQPGVLPIVAYLEALPYDAEPNCVEDHFYMINNTNPGFLPNGTIVPNPAAQGSIPPSPVKTIGDSLNAKNITWEYFGGQYNNAVVLAGIAAASPALLDNGAPLTNAALGGGANGLEHALGVLYCQICNPFQYATSIMTDIPAGSTHPAHLGDTVDLIADIQNTTLPSVSFGKPDGVLDGHPSSSKPTLFESYVQNVLDALEANPELKANTVVFITWDEAGGYYDSGYIQPIDFFGDGPRIPLLILSPYSTGGRVNHAYADHVSLDKFIERNWGLPPMTDRSRDNLPNPTAKASDPYVPTNSPALDDLFDAFDFKTAVNQPFFE